jgi:hypothetical protein
MSDVKQRVIAIVTGKEFVPKELIHLESDEVVVKRQAYLDELVPANREGSYIDKHLGVIPPVDPELTGRLTALAEDFAQGGVVVPDGTVYMVGERMPFPEPHHYAFTKHLSDLGGVLPAGITYGYNPDPTETIYPATGIITTHPILSVKSVKVDEVDITENVELAQGGHAGLCPEWKEFIANNRTAAAPEPNNDATGVSVDQAEPKKPFIRFEMAWGKGGAIWPSGKCDLEEFYRITGLDNLPSITHHRLSQ